MINLGPWTDYVRETIYNKCNNCTMDDTNKRFTSVNLMSYIIDKLIAEVLLIHTTRMNMLPEYRPMINFKNEFYFTKLLLAPVKKRYVASIKLKEGKEFNPEKAEIKGHDFKKAGCTEYIRGALEGIIKKRILQHDTADVVGILQDLDKLEKEIKHNVESGGLDFSVRLNPKVEKAYKSPFTTQAYMAALSWNMIVSDDEIILPAKVNAVLVNMTPKTDFTILKAKRPDIYEHLERNIFKGPVESFRKNGITCIALSNNCETVPDWLLPYVDVSAMVNRNINTFKPILVALGTKYVKASDKEYFSNIIEI